jgi:hypothetical protein
MNAKSIAISAWTVLCSVAMFVQLPTQGYSQPRDRAGGPVQSELEIHRVTGAATGGAVLDVGADGAFDAEWTSCPTVYHDDNGYRMWYSACYDANIEAGRYWFGDEPRWHSLETSE